ncbi:MAG TPA: DUF4157 domain-containing protein [Pyrinomonadaceae bacterium]|nr:DUF4157 domain-containing protein [Pyrinomonadaceae bacterium]
MFASDKKSASQQPAPAEGEKSGAQREAALNPIWRSLAFNSYPVQAKLAVSQPDDPHELEADRVADQVMRMAASPPDRPLITPLGPLEASRTCAACEENKQQFVQRKCAGCEEEEEGQRLQRQTSAGTTARPAVPWQLLGTLGAGGQPLDRATRSFFEPRFGRDFSGVRVHTGGAAEQSARDVQAKAYTVGSDIVFSANRFAPTTTEGKRLLAHELTHVAQSPSITAGGTRSNGSPIIYRTPEEAEALVSRHTSWGFLSEAGLGQELLQMALRGELALIDEVFTALGSTDRDDVAYELTLAATDADLVQLAGTSPGRRLLDRVFDEMTAGSVAAEEQAQADRIRQVTTRATVSASDFDAAATSGRTKIFPFRLPGFTVFNDAPIEARRVPGGIWAHSYVRVLGTSEFRRETSTLPTDYFLGGITLPESEVIGVRLYDQGGIIHYTTPLFLIQLANATTQQVLEKIIEAAGIGLTLGTGALAGLGVEATLAARVLLWADRAAFILGTLTSVLREHRSWIIENFGRGFMDAVDVVHSAVAIYGMARIAIEAPRMIRSLRDSYRAFREAAEARGSTFAPAEQTTIREVTQSTDELIDQVDNIRGARTPGSTAPRETAEPLPGTAGPEAPVPATEPRPSPTTEPSTPSTTREPVAEPSATEPMAPAAAGARGSYRPTQAELEGYADRAWRFLGGRGARPAVVETPLPPRTAGRFGSDPPTIEIGTGAESAGHAINTVWHEATHGRLRQIFGFLNEHLGHSWRRTLLRPLDEIASYFMGGLGRVVQGPTVFSRLRGLLEMFAAPFSAWGSMANLTERLLWIPHMLAYLAALVTAEVLILLRILRPREPEPRHPSSTP